MKDAHIFAQVAGKQVRLVKSVPLGAAGPLASAVTNRIEGEIKLMVPPLLAHTPNPLDLAACWVLVRETLLATGPADRIAKEAVAAAVSLANACPYRLEMHAIGVHGLGTADAIHSGGLSGVSDPASATSCCGRAPHTAVVPVTTLASLATLLAGTAFDRRSSPPCGSTARR